MRVRLVQPMITTQANWDLAKPPEIVSRLIELSSGGGGLADKTLLVWPESVFPFFMSQYPEGLARIDSFANRGLPDLQR